MGSCARLVELLRSIVFHNTNGIPSMEKFAIGILVHELIYGNYFLPKVLLHISFLGFLWEEQVLKLANLDRQCLGLKFFNFPTAKVRRISLTHAHIPE